MKILMFGKNGQLGQELQRSLTSFGELIALDRASANNHPQQCGNLLNLKGIEATIKALQPDIVVNAAAYTAVDRAEKEYALSDFINHQAVMTMAEACKAANALLVHYSTDYVFNGKCSRAWTEEDIPEPINQYGLSKYAGEQAILKTGCNTLIFRTSWIHSCYGNNFIKTILTLAQQRETLDVVNDQFGSPTSARLIADTTVRILTHYYTHACASALNGIYHLSATGKTSWYTYSQFIIAQATTLGVPLMIKNIQPVRSKDYPVQARRPSYSQLDTAKIQQTFKLCLPHWQEGVQQTLFDLIHHGHYAG